MDATKANEALEHLFEVAVLLIDSMEGGLRAQGLTRARAALIWQILQHGPMTQQALSQALRCTPRNVTGLVDALQTTGLVAREGHPTDRRATLVHLTEKGLHAAAAWQEQYQRLATQLFCDLTSADLTNLVAVLDRVMAHLCQGASPPSAASTAVRHAH
jgi:DNA-binding MarR family transcriptional regulator